MRALEKTTNLIDLYLHSRGEDDVPYYFHFWSIVSAIAAAVGNQVYFFRVRERPLYPNMYCILIGESGVGKGRAIEAVESILVDIGAINYQRTKLTAQFLFDLLSDSAQDPMTGETKVIANPRIYLCHPELAFYFGKGEHSQSLVETLTELYGGSCTFGEGTRMHGAHTVRGACINWLAGSTQEWMVKAVSTEAVMSGFFARVAVVYPEADPPRQMMQPTYPPDYYEVMEHIKARFLMLSMMQGEMVQTPGALNWMEGWLANRKEPEDRLLLPAWRRQRELIYKLAMILCLADGGPMVLREHHVIRGEKLSRLVIEKCMPSLVEFSHRSFDTRHTNAVEDIIARKVTVTRSQLTKLAYKRGINGAGVRAALADLRQSRQILVDTTTTGGEVYTWVGGDECAMN